MTRMESVSSIFSCRWEGCEEARQQFSSEEELYLHVIKAHSRRGKTSCRWSHSSSGSNATGCCDSLSRSRSHFIDHIITHFTPNLRPHVCEVRVGRERGREGLIEGLIEGLSFGGTVA